MSTANTNNQWALIELDRRLLGCMTFRHPKRCPKCGTKNTVRNRQTAVCLTCTLKERKRDA